MGSLNRLLVEQSCELGACKSHRGRSLLKWDVGAVQILGDVEGRFADGVLVAAVKLDNAESEHLGISVAEVEAGGFEHEALEADDCL